MPLTTDFTGVLRAMSSASALTEVTFLQAGKTLEASIEILAELTSSFDLVLLSLQSDDLSQALEALSRTAVLVDELGKLRSKDSADFDRMRCLTESIEQRITQMKTSLKDIESLAVNSKIAAVGIAARGIDFTSFAAEIGSTLNVTKQVLNSFAEELRVVRQRVVAACEGHLFFERSRQDVAASITERLLATVKSIALRHKVAARSGRDVKMSGGRVRQRICNAIVALQIGDITRQRLEHAEFALGLVTAAATPRDGSSETGDPTLDEDEQRQFAVAVLRLQSAQLLDAARDFDRDAFRITEALNNLASEARTLHDLGHSAYGTSDRGGGGFITELREQVGEALALFERFETARTGGAEVTRNVTDATASLCGHLQKVQSLEADIRIMGLNTTFKCARVGREGQALSLIAQELRTYANGFAKEAGALMGEVETVSTIASSFSGKNGVEQSALISWEKTAMRDSHVMLSRMGEMLDAALGELESDSDRVVTLLMETAEDLAARNEIGRVLRDAAAELTALLPFGHLDLATLPANVIRMLEVMEGGYTMAIERAAHDRVMGRTVFAKPSPVAAAEPELEDFLF